MPINLRHRIVVTNDFEVFSITRRARVGNVDAVMRGIFTSKTCESYANGHRVRACACQLHRGKGESTSEVGFLSRRQRTLGHERDDV